MSSVVSKLDIENWARKDHFNFYKNFDDPYYGLTANVDVKVAKDFCSSQDIPFFIW